MFLCSPAAVYALCETHTTAWSTLKLNLFFYLKNNNTHTQGEARDHMYVSIQCWLAFSPGPIGTQNLRLHIVSLGYETLNAFLPLCSHFYTFQLLQKPSEHKGNTYSDCLNRKSDVTSPYNIVRIPSITREACRTQQKASPPYHYFVCVLDFFIYWEQDSQEAPEIACAPARGHRASFKQPGTSAGGGGLWRGGT